MRIEDCTVVMTTYGNHDFTRAATWALRRYHPDIRIIYADGHPTDPFSPAKHEKKHNLLVWSPGEPTEVCRNNAILSWVPTDYILLMDNDVKVISSSALIQLMEVFERYPDTDATGWYGLVLDPHQSRQAYVGTRFAGIMDIDATQASFSLHRRSSYVGVGGMPLRPIYDIPEGILTPKSYHHGGDFAICLSYDHVRTPASEIPLIHWTHANRWMDDGSRDRSFDDWWDANTTHIKVDPLNNWMDHAR